MQTAQEKDVFKNAVKDVLTFNPETKKLLLK